MEINRKCRRRQIFYSDVSRLDPVKDLARYENAAVANLCVCGRLVLVQLARLGLIIMKLAITTVILALVALISGGTAFVTPRAAVVRIVLESKARSDVPCFN